MTTTDDSDFKVSGQKMKPATLVLFHVQISEGACGMACAGDAAHKCGAGFKSSVYSIAGISPGGPFSIPAKLTDTTGWTATASHIREDGAHGPHFPSHAIDGNEADTHRWATPVALQEPYPWLQVQTAAPFSQNIQSKLGNVSKPPKI